MMVSGALTRVLCADLSKLNLCGLAHKKCKYTKSETARAIFDRALTPARRTCLWYMRARGAWFMVFALCILPYQRPTYIYIYSISKKQYKNKRLSPLVLLRSRWVDRNRNTTRKKIYITYIDICFLGKLIKSIQHNAARYIILGAVWW